MDLQIGEKLKELRTEKGKTLKEVQEAIGLSDSYISLIENNKREPTISALKKLAPYYNVSLGYFFSEQDTKNYLGMEIFYARQAKNLSPSDLAKLMDTDVLRIGLLETGIEYPTDEEQQKIRKILDPRTK